MHLENYLQEYLKLGINRISIGFQSFDADILSYLDRIHSPEDCIVTYNNLREIGFTNINADLIFSIPGQSLDRWIQDLNTLIKLEPEHISIYSLTVEKGTPLYRSVKNGLTTMPTEEFDYKMYSNAIEYLQNNNYNQYEISNFALQNKECKHNLHYWNLDNYLAFGPSAHGHDNKIRWWNVRSLDTYIKKLSNNELPISGKEILNKKDMYNELLYNGLRLSSGIKIEKLIKVYPNKDFNNYLNYNIDKWKHYLNKSDILKLNNKGLMIADTIASDMFI